jgi:hypothetical protein
MKHTSDDWHGLLLPHTLPSCITHTPPWMLCKRERERERERRERERERAGSIKREIYTFSESMAVLERHAQQ